MCMLEMSELTGICVVTAFRERSQRLYEKITVTGVF